MTQQIERRAFLKAVALGCGGMAIGWWLPAAEAQDGKAKGTFAPNAWIRITKDVASRPHSFGLCSISATRILRKPIS